MLDRFLNPRRIALIGASEGTAKIGGRILHTMLAVGWQGAIHPVNRKGGTIHGLPASRSIAAEPMAALRSWRRGHRSRWQRLLF